MVFSTEGTSVPEARRLFVLVQADVQQIGLEEAQAAVEQTCI